VGPKIRFSRVAFTTGSSVDVVLSDEVSEACDDGVLTGSVSLVHEVSVTIGNMQTVRTSRRHVNCVELIAATLILILNLFPWYR